MNCISLARDLLSKCIGTKGMAGGYASCKRTGWVATDVFVIDDVSISSPPVTFNFKLENRIHQVELSLNCLTSF